MVSFAYIALDITPASLGDSGRALPKRVQDQRAKGEANPAAIYAGDRSSTRALKCASKGGPGRAGRIPAWRIVAAPHARGCPFSFPPFGVNPMTLFEFERELKFAQKLPAALRRERLDYLKSADVTTTDENGQTVTVKTTIIESENEPMTDQEIEQRFMSVLKRMDKPVTPFNPYLPGTGEGSGQQSKVFKGPNGTEKAARFGAWLKSSLFNIGTKTLSEGVDTAGGYLVPDEFSADIINLVNEYGAFRQYARVLPMSTDTRRVPRVTGRPTAYWVSELGEGTASDASFDQVTLVARKLMVLNVHSSEIREDSAINLADLLGQEFARQLAYQEDAAGINGDATSTYGGITGIVTRLSTINGVDDGGGLTLASGNLWSEIVLSDLTKLMSRLPTYARRNAGWYVSPAFADSVLLRLAMAAGGATGADIANGAAQRSFLGYPVRPIETMPTTEGNSQICALFGDLSLAATFGDRRQVASRVSTPARSEA